MYLLLVSRRQVHGRRIGQYLGHIYLLIALSPCYQHKHTNYDIQWATEHT